MKTWDKQRQAYKNLKPYYYHLSSDGWKEGYLFHNTGHYSFGMTLMGLLTLRFGIVIYDFTLMPNHIHILLKGDGDECLNAFDYFRMKLSARLVRDGYKPLPEDYGFKLTPIDTEDQMRINFLYLARNPYEQNTTTPGGYPWGSAYLHFSRWGKYLHGVRSDEMSKRKLERITGTRMAIPPSWVFHTELGVLPSCFVDQSLFMRLFSTPKDYETRLVKNYEAFVKLSRSLEDSLCFSQEETLEIVQQAMRSMYPGRRMNTLYTNFCLPKTTESSGDDA